MEEEEEGEVPEEKDDLYSRSKRQHAMLSSSALAKEQPVQELPGWLDNIVPSAAMFTNTETLMAQINTIQDKYVSVVGLTGNSKPIFSKGQAHRRSQVLNIRAQTERLTLVEQVCTHVCVCVCCLLTSVVSV